VLENYRERTLDESVFRGSITDFTAKNPQFFGYFLKHELIKISTNPAYSTRFLQRIEEMLRTAPRNIARVADLKVLLWGGPKFAGLVAASFAAGNEVVGMAFLRCLRALMEP
jgi:hypothetical protein